MLKLPNNVI